MTPYLKSLETNGEHLIFGGFFPGPETSSGIPAELLPQFVGTTNLVCYDWELTEARSEQWLYAGQFLRFVCFMEQMPLELASREWLKTVSVKLGNSVTAVTRTAPNQLSFVRRSTLGFTGIELQLLSDWLEAPGFPSGLHSFIPAPPNVLPAPPQESEPKNSPK